MLRLASANDLNELRELFADANDAPYDLAAVAEEKCFGDGVAGPSSVRVWEEDGGIRGVAVTCGRYLRILAVARDARRRGIGSALLADSGARVIGAEAGNYFTPGVVESDANTIAFFRKHGYVEKATTWNLDVDLAGVHTTSAIRTTPGDAPRVLAFIENEFGRIWRFEAAKAFAYDPPRMFHAEENGAVIGFAVHDVNNAGLGFFGPTGVALSRRGRGIGRRLLLASLGDLRRLGHTHAVIPWTDALEFYEKACGAKPAYRFVTLIRAQGAGRRETENVEC